jgi:hypothetical protein
MQKPDVRFSARKLLDSFGHYVLAQLRANPALTAEAETFATTQEDLSRKLEEYHQAVGLGVQQIAARDAAHDSLVETVRMFHLAVKLQAKGDLGSPLHFGYFPDGIEKVTSGTLEDCILQTQNILRQLETETIPEILTHLTPLTSALEAARTALQALRDAREGRSAASKLLYQEKIRWIDIYLQVYARLRIHHHRSPKRAEKYFRKSKARRKDEKEDGTQGGAQSTTQGTTESASRAATTSVAQTPAEESPDAGDDKVAV